MPNKPPKPQSPAIYNPFTAKSRAEQSAQEMYPGKIGQDDQRDAARHMLASGYLARAWNPGVADLIGKAHEFKETPFRHLGALVGATQHRYDRPIDLHNNSLGIELSQKATSMEEFERLVNEAAERARPTQTPGAPWVPSAKDAEAMRKGSAQYAGGGAVAAFNEGGSADKGGGAAFGVFPQMRARRTRQDPEAAKSVPLAAARGAVAGVLGAPGDIESLVRMLPGLDESTTFLPTSEDIERRLPMRELAATPVGKAATGLGTLAGGFYTGPGAPLRAVAAIPGALRHGASEFVKASAPTANVVKPEGGDWLAGAVQRGVSGLKKYDLPDLFPEIGTPPPNSPANEAINKWVGSNLGNYLQKQMATPSDPVRKLAEEGITHLPDLATRTASFPAGALQKQRTAAGFPEHGMGQSELAKKWENLADESIFTHRAGDIQKSAEVASKLDEVKAVYFDRLAEIDAKMAERLTSRGFNEDEAATMMRVMPPKQKAEVVGDDGFYAISREYERAAIESQGPNAMIAKDNPWLAKLDPEAPAYHGDVYDLGFDHVVDVLGDMVATGRIRPEQLNKVSLEQAIRMTHQYDIEMAEKAAKATAAAREGLPVHKEYPEGFRWVELNRPGAFAAESEAMGHSVRGYEPPRGHPDWAEGSGGSGHLGYGHGGWEGIKSGQAKVYSLVDAKGQPHVTVEVAKSSPGRFHDLSEDARDEVLDLAWDKIRSIDDPSLWNKEGNLSDNGRMKMQDIQEALTKEWVQQNAASLPSEITQIKGKSNRAPKEEYLPFVQDFVKSGQWSDVGDIGNAGLRDVQSWINPGTMDEYRKLGLDVPKYATDDELDVLHKLYESRANPPTEGYAGGGSVKTGIKEGVNLARRSLFGLKPSQDMAGRELVPMQKDLDRMQAELAKAEKVAPKVEQKTTTVTPSPTAPKIEETVRSIAETPVSRRTVLKTAAGQVMQNALPASSFADLMKPATVAKQAVQAMAPTYGLASVPGLVAKFMRQGMTPEEAGRTVEKMVPGVLEKWPEIVADRIRAPAETMPHVDEGTPLMWIFGEMIKPAHQTSPFGLRPHMREMQRLSPEDYSALKETARDIKEYGFEP